MTTHKENMQNNQENWEDEFDRTWKNTEGITVLDKPLKDFIRTLLSLTSQRVREEVLEECISIVEAEYWDVQSPDDEQKEINAMIVRMRDKMQSLTKE